MPWSITGKLTGGTLWLNMIWWISAPSDKHLPLTVCVCVRVCVPAGRGLVWTEDTEMSYTNWETHDVAFSVLSPNSCFWIQSNSGLWKPGSCRNRTHGVICKQPRSKRTETVWRIRTETSNPIKMITNCCRPFLPAAFSPTFAGVESSVVTCKFDLPPSCFLQLNLGKKLTL